MNMMPFISAGPGPCSAFTNITQPLFAKVREGADENKTLTALRDLLLPKLISGEIRVRDAEKMVEERV
jgi:type I restriction enzyme S subunit